jgi:hypothetical protein
MSRPSPKQNPSGNLRLDGTDLVYSSVEQEYWRLPVAKVRVIGEYTTAAGPGLDDYFFVFVTDDSESWFEASFYADGGDSFLSELNKLLGAEIRAGLCNSISWKTRVLWPKTLEGEELFIIIPEAAAAGLLGRLRQKMFPRGTLKLAQRALEAVNEKRN